MDDRIFDIAELVSKYMTGELTAEEQRCLAVSYTHLTLPTNREV